MSQGPTSICLSMIVKNEAHVLARCIASVRRFITCWAIVDTGSTDATRAVVARALGDLPGTLYERPWSNFGTNRSEALALARPMADYSLVMDADDTLAFSPGIDVPLPTLTDDSYALRVEDCELSYYRIHFVRNALPWRYDGVLHEYAICEEAQTRGVLEGLIYHRNYDGARSADPQKYLKDAAILEAALRVDSTNARNVFYLAQSYRDANDVARAIANYEKRASLGGWNEEVFYSLLQVARLYERAAREPSVVWGAYLQAHRARPARAEAACDLARYCRLAGDYALAHMFASAAMAIPRPDDTLFVDEGVYAWRAVDEYAIAAYWVGKYKESREANERLLASGKLPVGEVERVKKNLAFSVAKL